MRTRRVVSDCWSSVDGRRELAFERAHGRARRLRGAARDEIGDRLGLQQIDLVVQERAQRELAGLRGTRAERKRGGQQRVADDAPTVAVELDDVLARERVRTREEQHEASIERGTAGVAKGAELGLPRLRLDAA